MQTRRSLYRRHRFPPDIISHAVWLYYRFALSFRDVEDLHVKRGVTVTYETIRQWCGKFGRGYARQLQGIVNLSRRGRRHPPSVVVRSPEITRYRGRASPRLLKLTIPVRVKLTMPRRALHESGEQEKADHRKSERQLGGRAERHADGDAEANPTGPAEIALSGELP